MVHLKKSSERGVTDIGWLKSFHSFSFGDFYNPDMVHFGSLRVLNDDYVQPGEGFPTHPHKNMEIITYVVEGELEHKDSMGTKEVIHTNEVQKMSAGRGVYHSEYNPSSEHPVHLFQTWILPNKKGLEPYYEQIKVELKDKLNKLLKVASPDGEENTVYVSQDAHMYVSRLEKGNSMTHVLGEGRGGYLQIISGTVVIEDTSGSVGDALLTGGPGEYVISASEDAELILFDVAMKFTY